MPIAGAVPAVARDLVGFTDSAGRQHDSFRAKNSEPPALAIIAEGSNHALAGAEQGEDANFHVNFDALMHAVILQGADHFQAGAIADMRETRILMPAEIPL